MGDKQNLIGGVGQGLKSIVEESVERVGEESQKILKRVITGEELLGLGEAKMTPEEMAQKQAEDERHKKEEIEKLKNQMNQGKKLEQEMEEIREGRERMEGEEERKEEQEEQKKEFEEQQRSQEAADLMMESTNPAKQKKSRGSALARKKKSQPDQDQMSQTQEFKGKIN